MMLQTLESPECQMSRDDSATSMVKTAPEMAPMPAPRSIPLSVASPIIDPVTAPTSEPTDDATVPVSDVHSCSLVQSPRAQRDAPVAKTQVITAQSTLPARPHAAEPRPEHCRGSSGAEEEPGELGLGPGVVEGSRSIWEN